MLWLHGPQISYKYDLVEIFAGRGRVSEAFRDAGRTAAMFDRDQNKDQDFLTRGGFARLAYT